MNQAKIYILRSDKTDKVYYGSTCTSLQHRWNNHRSLYIAYLNGNANKTTAFEIISLDPDNFTIELVEDCSWCWDRYELRERERYYIENFTCVNKNIPNRSHKDCMIAYYNKHKDKLIEKRKQYYLDNRDTIIQKTTQYNKQNLDKYREYQAKYQAKYRAAKKQARQNAVKNI